MGSNAARSVPIISWQRPAQRHLVPDLRAAAALPHEKKGKSETQGHENTSVPGEVSLSKVPEQFLPEEQRAALRGSTTETKVLWKSHFSWTCCISLTGC
ncbi:hypothetical protein OJAV_G00117720 [Oryzias javanicus]|uniref:Uncharacterized protein n=1 Tax=Oryzias javanicus TaxID=123683 RepID=A0A437CSZ2_ORYJA|nr:hypothetical protein OJAV_G00117720 [Oryzias javanicus]